MAQHRRLAAVLARHGRNLKRSRRRFGGDSIGYNRQVRKDHISVLVCLAAITAVVWAASDREISAPRWQGRIAGFAYSPMQPSQRPDQNEFPTEAELQSDLALIAQYANSIRTYSIDGTLAAIPRLARNENLEVTPGVWLGPDKGRNAAQIERLVDLVAGNENVTRVVIGNETQLVEAVSDAELYALLDAARAALDVPVSTAEPWHVWLSQPELANHVDFLTVHLLPYWEGFSESRASALIGERLAVLEQAFPGRKVVIGEVGWPSNGRARGEARASVPAAESFLRRYLAAADARGDDYFLMEAIDQPWKQSIEGTAGAHWGWLDAGRSPKYSLDTALSRLPHWPVFAAAAVSLFMLAYWLLRTGVASMRLRGFWLLGLMAAATANASMAAIVDQAARYWTLGSLICASLLGAGMIALVAVLFVEAREWAEVRFASRRRVPASRQGIASAPQPRVSIHVPVHAEPPAMVAATLEALARLDYDDYEVVVVDNNTSQPELWRPIAACCKRLGGRFRFFHIEEMAGYKAGALNFALQQTSPGTEIIAVVDSDYCVQRNWLRENVHHFANPRVAIVQAPQDYRDERSSLFKRLCKAEYAGFFRIGMLTRNDRNAIIQHGTMTLIRARALREVGGWAEWTVTEDAELGLRLLGAGYDAVYSPQSYGQGLTPDSFRDYRAQRYRWVLGAVQILRRHARMLLGRRSGGLRFGQRVQFLTGWLPWLGDGLNLIFNVFAIAWSALMIMAPDRFNPPLAILSAFVLAAFVFKLVKTVVLYRWHMHASWTDTACACVAGFALIYVVGRAVLAGVCSAAPRPFLRTPKCARPQSFFGALVSAAPECLMALMLLASAAGVVATAPFASPDGHLWAVLLVVFALPHAAALAIALLAAGRRRAPSRRAPLVGVVSRAERF
jgi:exo-beta-1,3-glucanase (GH17 family)/cellulose synthase/poly-beta-1,6-N-acetylglucosamine synthase-like glycosyltransferase